MSSEKLQWYDIPVKGEEESQLPQQDIDEIARIASGKTELEGLAQDMNTRLPSEEIS